MKILRTPDKFFRNIKGYPFDPVYTDIFTEDGSKIRIHHIDEGPSDGPILLAMHGQPVWSYLYSKMIPILNDAGIRVIAPDLVGYGKSDKPASRNDYSYQNQVDWMNQWLVKNDLNNLIFFGQDWGGLIGLRMIVDNPDRFIKISMGNTGLPYMPNTPKDVIDKVVSELDVGFGKIGLPLRLALTSNVNSPSIDLVCNILGKEISLNRLDNFLSKIKDQENDQ